MGNMIQIAMTQPYIPRYRVELFDLIHAELQSSGFNFRVFWGCGERQRSEVLARNDAADGPWAEEVKTLEFPGVPGNPFIYRRVPAQWDRGLLVTEMQVSNLNAWARMGLRRPYVTVGHGKSYLGPEPRAAVFLESQLNRRASHVCTYTEGGRREVLLRTGLDSSAVTAFNNATAASSASTRFPAAESQVDSFRARNGIPRNAKVALYIGALAEYKRVDLLVDAFRKVLAQDPNWWLVVAGDGPERAVVDRLANETGRVSALGNTGPEEAAIAASTANLLVNPGRVGLVAVDALAWELPLLTTYGAPHAPEFDYLTVGETVHVSEPTGSALAAVWMQERGPIVFPKAPSIEEAAHLLATSFMRTAVSVRSA